MQNIINYIKNKNLLTLFLIFISTSLFLSVFLKAVFDVDVSYDTWAYHLPFASRIWEIAPVGSFTMFHVSEVRFEGFPLLGEFLQGLFWMITGRPESANLVSFFSLALYIYFLKQYFKVPLYLSILALLAVPLIQIHATTAYVDLAGNIAVSMLFFMTFLMYTRANFDTKRNYIVMALAGFCAINLKLQLAPFVFIFTCLILLKIILLKFKCVCETGSRIVWLAKALPLMFVISLVIFATPVKNLIVHGNPVYPVRLDIAGVTLNYKHEQYSFVPPYLEGSPKIKAWGYSIAEIGIRPFDHFRRWTVDQGMPDESTGNRMGGFFNLYVLFHILLLAYICIRFRTRETFYITGGFVLLSLLAANMPQSHELRYYMFWMIILVSINLKLVANEGLVISPGWINTRYFGIVCLAFLLVVVDITNKYYVVPHFKSTNKLLVKYVDSKVIEQIKNNDTLCVSRKNQPWAFLYSSYFHSPLIYSVKVNDSIAACGSAKLIGNWD